MDFCAIDIGQKSAVDLAVVVGADFDFLHLLHCALREERPYGRCRNQDRSPNLPIHEMVFLHIGAQT